MRRRGAGLKAPVMRTLALSLVLLATSNDLAAACLGRDPMDAAKVFFAKHRDFYYGNPGKVAGLVSSRFYAALSAEYRCAQGEVCAIEAPPWTDAQDGHIGEPITFHMQAASETRAEVFVRYTFELSETQRIPQAVSLRLERKGRDGCWAVADLVSPRGKSLVKAIEDWHSTYGAASFPAPGRPR